MNTGKQYKARVFNNLPAAISFINNFIRHGENNIYILEEIKGEFDGSI